MSLIFKSLAVLAVGLVIAASAEAGGRHRRPAAVTTDGYSNEWPAGPGNGYRMEPATPRTRFDAPRGTTYYGPSVPTYGWNFSPSEGWGFRWSNSPNTGSFGRTYGWGYTPGKGWGFDWR